MAPLPLIKIGAVLWKEVSKPLAAQIKLFANSHPSVRRLAMGDCPREAVAAARRLGLPVSTREVNKYQSFSCTVGRELWSA
jgi:hypothetical protein